ncbi:uncharacterized protein K444DRAFT_29313 [Hyaloscypha bicolor E]|uniref:Uncharacterized protein n=1 Tax=Hyaloscypha bicolor E TaxID=1095630 RepID=A0A2J6T3C1_9HELO|nr:uncharacterized protein K444DRAFT_29313 [Hyaloscypha bicolor E]PMD57528.1 hypothetical protein K444DRAFT_29313 [Hyaloscypha bicolor E]
MEHKYRRNDTAEKFENLCLPRAHEKFKQKGRVSSNKFREAIRFHQESVDSLCEFGAVARRRIFSKLMEYEVIKCARLGYRMSRFSKLIEYEVVRFVRSGMCIFPAAARVTRNSIDVAVGSTRRLSRYESSIDEAMELPGRLLRYESSIDGHMDFSCPLDKYLNTKVVSARLWFSIGRLSRCEDRMDMDGCLHGMPVSL